MMRFAASKLGRFGRSVESHEAEDAVQNAFVKIVKNIDKIDFSRGEKRVKNYCFSILVNEIYNFLEENIEIFEFVEEFWPDEEYNYIEELNMQENYARVVKAIEELDERYSTTLYLVFSEEKTVGEIAEMMGISPKTVYTRLARGKKLLLDSLKEVNYD
jgi:RNA polymerase sigma-70 factor (ECF subfamily)